MRVKLTPPSSVRSRSAGVGPSVSVGITQPRGDSSLESLCLEWGADGVGMLWIGHRTFFIPSAQAAIFPL